MARKVWYSIKAGILGLALGLAPAPARLQAQEAGGPSEGAVTLGKAGAWEAFAFAMPGHPDQLTCSANNFAADSPLGIEISYQSGAAEASLWLVYQTQNAAAYEKLLPPADKPAEDRQGSARFLIALDDAPAETQTLPFSYGQPEDASEPQVTITALPSRLIQGFDRKKTLTVTLAGVAAERYSASLDGYSRERDIAFAACHHPPGTVQPRPVAAESAAPDRLAADCRSGDRVFVWANGAWVPGRIDAPTDGRACVIHLDGDDSGGGVNLDRARRLPWSADGPGQKLAGDCRPNEAVLSEIDGVWYPAQILAVDSGGSCRIRFEDMTEQSVPKSGLRRVAADLAGLAGP